MSDGHFLPEYLRPRAAARRPRRRLLLLSLLPALLLLPPLWTVQAVELHGGAGLPEAARVSLSELTGSSLFALDLGWVRRQVELWPGVAAVDVRLELPGSLVVQVEPATAVASVAVGRGWIAVNRDGRLAGRLSAPVEPVLSGFPHSGIETRDGLTAVRRLQRASGATVARVRRITPEDLEVELTLAGSSPGQHVVRVRPHGSAAERRWCAMAAAGETVGGWADLRGEQWMVVADAGGGS